MKPGTKLFDDNASLAIEFPNKTKESYLEIVLYIINYLISTSMSRASWLIYIYTIS